MERNDKDAYNETDKERHAEVTISYKSIGVCVISGHLKVGGHSGRVHYEPLIDTAGSCVRIGY